MPELLKYRDAPSVLEFGKRAKAPSYFVPNAPSGALAFTVVTTDTSVFPKTIQLFGNTSSYVFNVFDLVTEITLSGVSAYVNRRTKILNGNSVGAQIKVITGNAGTLVDIHKSAHILSCTQNPIVVQLDRPKVIIQGTRNTYGTLTVSANTLDSGTVFQDCNPVICSLEFHGWITGTNFSNRLEIIPPTWGMKAYQYRVP